MSGSTRLVVALAACAAAFGVGYAAGVSRPDAPP
jgi:hypothetical protein